MYIMTLCNHTVCFMFHLFDIILLTVVSAYIDLYMYHDMCICV